MNQYVEWKDLAREIDKNNPYSDLFIYPNGDKFYIEPVFYLKLNNFKMHYLENYNDVLKEMERLVKRNHLVVFIGDDDEEITEVPNAIYLTIQDVTNPLGLFVEDKSRGSDYGD